MARVSAINPTIAALLEALDVEAMRTVCVGGVHRGPGPGRIPPYVDVSGASEQPMDALGSDGSTVTVPITVVTSGQHPGGDAQAAEILSAAIALAEQMGSPAGWSVREAVWTGTTLAEATDADGLPLWRAVGQLSVWMEPS